MADYIANGFGAWRFIATLGDWKAWCERLRVPEERRMPPSEYPVLAGSIFAGGAPAYLCKSDVLEMLETFPDTGDLRAAANTEPMRVDVHGFEAEHSDCPNPALCACDCRTCKRVWATAGRPSPKDLL